LPRLEQQFALCSLAKIKTLSPAGEDCGDQSRPREPPLPPWPPAPPGPPPYQSRWGVFSDLPPLLWAPLFILPCLLLGSIVKRRGTNQSTRGALMRPGFAAGSGGPYLHSHGSIELVHARSGHSSSSASVSVASVATGVPVPFPTAESSPGAVTGVPVVASSANPAIPIVRATPVAASEDARV
jgi:hypothetical protein